MLENQEKEKKNSDIRDTVVELLEVVNGLVDWSKISDDLRRKWNSILAKRVAMVSRSVNKIEDFVERLLKELTGDTIFLSKEKAEGLKNALEKVDKVGSDKVLEYLRRYPYLSVVFYVASKGGEKNEGDTQA